jgi:spore maturation protein SpmA
VAAEIFIINTSSTTILPCTLVTTRTITCTEFTVTVQTSGM